LKWGLDLERTGSLARDAVLLDTIHTAFISIRSVMATDRLHALLEHFRVRATLFHSGKLCGVRRFDAGLGHGLLHVLRRGAMAVTHPKRSGLPARVELEAPLLFFYPRPTTHQFHNPPIEGSDLTCAAVDFVGGLLNPLARALPPLIVLPLERVEGLGAALDLLFAETERPACGQRHVADRLCEVVLIKLLRWLLDHPAEAGIRAGLITGLSEPRLARALIAVHEAPGDAWTLERLAECAGMSRTRFALTFKSVVGQTPAEYVADWRVTLAQARLRDGRPIKLLAAELGYANPSALSRVFAARTGRSPREWVKRDRAGALQGG
jgi:AraC-like DNA-binding protein